MFPFIWWLGGETPEPEDTGQHEGGSDFLRRRVLMATMARRGGMPLAAAEWFYAAPQFVTIDGSGLVQSWRGRGPLGFELTAALDVERPTWEQVGGWSASRSSVMFPGGKNLGTNSALATLFNGSDVPFWLFITGEITDLSNERTLASWDDAVSAQSKCWVTSTDGYSSYTRVDDGASSSATQSATANGVGVDTHRRMGWAFNGTQITTYVDLTTTLSNASANVGAFNATRLRVGDGLGAGDSLIGRIVEIVIGTGVPLQSDWARYYNYSIAEWGP